MSAARTTVSSAERSLKEKYQLIKQKKQLQQQATNPEGSAQIEEFKRLIAASGGVKPAAPARVTSAGLRRPPPRIKPVGVSEPTSKHPRTTDAAHVPPTGSTQPPPATAPSDSETTVYVGNMSLDTTSQDLCSLFEPFGEIASIKMIQGKTYSFVKFTSVESAQEAIKTLNGAILKGNTIQTDKAWAQRKLTPKWQKHTEDTPATADQSTAPSTTQQTEGYATQTTQQSTTTTSAPPPRVNSHATPTTPPKRSGGPQEPTDRSAVTYDDLY
ncbi:hypothetical protein Pelo_12024 [Pelomyxa schiedti]|nr:hypothetical protein Pelo_12024 [Pelomyxa schiedti]